MTPERLARIKANHETYLRYVVDDDDEVGELLSEVERLRSELAESQRILASLAARVSAQAEILAEKAERQGTAVIDVVMRQLGGQG